MILGCGSDKTVNPTDNDYYNKDLAREMKADDYGMSVYIIALLKKGPNRDLDSLAQISLQAAHMENIRRMAEQGSLSIAGPFLDDGEVRGIYIFNVDSVDKAKELTNTDPAIQAGSLVMELHPWYGPAGLKYVNEFNKQLSLKSF